MMANIRSTAAFILHFLDVWKKQTRLLTTIPNCINKVNGKSGVITKHIHSDDPHQSVIPTLLSLHPKVNYCTCEPDPPGRHFFHKESEKALNRYISVEMNASFAYLSMACYFSRSNIAQPGSYYLFMQFHQEQYKHALSLIQYQNLRGGIVELCPVCIPDKNDWCGILEALEVSLEMGKLLKQKLIELTNIAKKHNDLQMEDFLINKLLDSKEAFISRCARLVCRARKMNKGGSCVFLYDKELFKCAKKKSGENSGETVDCELPELYI